MATINSSATPYCTPPQLRQFYDVRNLADWASDDGTRVGGAPNPNTSIFDANPNVLASLAYAGGLFEAAILRSNRYLVADIQKLVSPVSPATLTVSGNLAIRINAALAAGSLFERRPNKSKPPAFYGAALQMLESLADGERLFAFAENEAASIPSDYLLSPADVYEQNLVATQAGRYFGLTGDLLCPFGVPGR